MGLANAAEYLGFPYGSTEFFRFQQKVHSFMRDACYNASIDLAREKGSFPLFDSDKYLAGEFIKTLPEDIRWKIKKYGIRNSHLTSIAPTGTISMACDGVSGGIEPVIFHEASRVVHMKDGPQRVTLKDYNVWKYGIHGRTALEVSPAEHVGALIMAANYVDSAVSKTCNVPSDTPWDEFKSLYTAAWEGGAKGCTTYTHGGSKEALITAAKDHPEVAEVKSCAFDPDTGVRSCE
jgi:ribonucleoside-diphosphate reductase alpha chain